MKVKIERIKIDGHELGCVWAERAPFSGSLSGTSKHDLTQVIFIFIHLFLEQRF